MKEKELVYRCLQNERRAQTLLYKRYAPAMKTLCIRYARNSSEAEDILQEGFIRVFAGLPLFNFKGSFEGWIRRIIRNTAINWRKSTAHLENETVLEDYISPLSGEEQILGDIYTNDIMGLVESLPNGYRRVFKMYVIQGYLHHEIGKRLRISVNTSKSQYFKARMNLRTRLRSQEYYKLVMDGLLKAS